MKYPRNRTSKLKKAECGKLGWSLNRKTISIGTSLVSYLILIAT